LARADTDYEPSRSFELQALLQLACLFGKVGGEVFRARMLDDEFCMNGNTTIKLIILVAAVSPMSHWASGQTHELPVANAYQQDDFVEGYPDETAAYGPSCCASWGGNGSRARIQFFSRTLPPGNLTQRFPYEAPRFYYYDRPYNAFQADRRFQETTSSAMPHQPYAKQVFSSVYEQMERQILDSRFLGYADNEMSIDDRFLSESSHEQIARDKNFEFTDWRKHHRSRMEWEYEQALVEQSMVEQRAIEQRTIEQAADQTPMSSPIELKDAGHLKVPNEEP